MCHTGTVYIFKNKYDSSLYQVNVAIEESRDVVVFGL